jgi:inorganic pyrophosphatase
MVGDCVGSSADVFESVAAEIIGAMILGATLSAEHGMVNSMPFMLFPLAVHAMDIVVSSVGIMIVKVAHSTENPMICLTRGYRITATLATIGFLICVRIMLYVDDVPGAWLHFAGCGLTGILNGYVFIQTTQYFTDYEYK